MLTSTPSVLDNTELTNQLTWDFNSGIEAFDYLAADETLILTYTIQVTDSQGATGTQTVVLTINGTNDAPVITDGPDAVGLAVNGSALTTSGSLRSPTWIVATSLPRRSIRSPSVVPVPAVPLELSTMPRWLAI
jgi:VCBS repeat-containing protein